MQGKKQGKKFDQKWLRWGIVLAVVAVLVIGTVVTRQDNTVAIGEAAEPVASDYVEIVVRDYGTITAELYGNVAPITVANFLKLADEGFYNGLTFHRIISGFMIQGGDPKGNGTGGSPERIKGEFAANGVANGIAHERGVLSMARSTAYDSASSQFFIMHADAPHLNGQYAAFGRVISGIEVVDAICEATRVQDNNGTVLAADQPVIECVRRIDRPGETEEATEEPAA